MCQWIVFQKLYDMNSACAQRIGGLLGVHHSPPAADYDSASISEVESSLP